MNVSLSTSPGIVKIITQHLQQRRVSSNSSSSRLGTKRTAPIGVQFGFLIYWLTLVRQRGSPSGSVSLPPYIAGSSSSSMYLSKTSCQLAVRPEKKQPSIHQKVGWFWFFSEFGIRVKYSPVSHRRGCRSCVLCSHSESAWRGCRPQERVWGLQEKNIKVLTKRKAARIETLVLQKAGYDNKKTKTNKEMQVESINYSPDLDYLLFIATCIHGGKTNVPLMTKSLFKPSG